MRLELELRVGGDPARAQWVDVREQVAADPVAVDELEDARLFRDLVGLSVGGAPVDLPAERLETNGEVREDVLVEAMAAQEELLDARQERSGLGPLDDAMVVGRRERHHLGDREARECGRRHGARTAPDTRSRPSR